MAALSGKDVSFEEINRIAQPGYFLNWVDPTTARTGEALLAQSPEDLTRKSRTGYCHLRGLAADCCLSPDNLGSKEQSCL